MVQELKGPTDLELGKSPALHSCVSPCSHGMLESFLLRGKALWVVTRSPDCAGVGNGISALTRGAPGGPLFHQVRTRQEDAACEFVAELLKVPKFTGTFSWDLLCLARKQASVV